jgi:glycosyltransferase involved in cell wall biosynthesis
MLKLLFVCDYRFYPELSGGSERSNLYLLKSLYDMGWQIEVICTSQVAYSNESISPYLLNLCSRVWKRLSKLLGLPPMGKVPVVVDEKLGFPCWRVIPNKYTNEHRQAEFFAQRLRDYQPDVVLGQRVATYPILQYSASKGYLTLCFLRDIEGIADCNYLKLTADGINFIANSPYLASLVNLISSCKPDIVLPFINPPDYRVNNRGRNYITFINPVPEKGLNVAIEVARQLPQEKFLFVKGDWVGDDISLLLEQGVYKLPNVEIWEKQEDMRNVYAVTDILIVPSQWPETFGRVIIEAQANSIPVVAANIGGIPYTLGKGGILVDPIDNSQAYVESIKKLRAENVYTELSELAFQNSQSPDFDAQYQVKQFVQLVEENINQKQQFIRSKKC